MKSNPVLLFGLLLLGLAGAGCNTLPAAVPATSTPQQTIVVTEEPTTAQLEPTQTPSALATITALPATSITGVVVTVTAGGTPPAVKVGTFVAPTIAAIPGSLPIAVLKYKILAQFGDIFFCDPDYYPVAREVPPDEIARRVAEIKKNADLYEAIVQHLGLSATAVLTPDQTLAVYNEYKKLNAILLQPKGNVYQFDVRVGSDRQGTAISGTIDPQGNITVTSRQPAILMCPICLAAGTRIATPNGDVAVEQLRVGMRVWTIDARGARQVATIRQTIARPLSPGAALIHLTLADGRELYASPAHPTIDGRSLASLFIGDMVDGAQVAHIEWFANTGGATYDILPDGETGAYWANGVLLGSTLGR